MLISKQRECTYLIHITYLNQGGLQLYEMQPFKGNNMIHICLLALC